MAVLRGLGFSVLASTTATWRERGSPRQVARPRALDRLAGLDRLRPGPAARVDRPGIAIWSFSVVRPRLPRVSGSRAGDPGLAAAIAQTRTGHGRRVGNAGSVPESPAAHCSLVSGVASRLLGSLAGRQPRLGGLAPAAGNRREMLTTRRAQDGGRALVRTSGPPPGLAAGGVAALRAARSH